MLRLAPSLLRVRLGGRVPIKVTHCITYRCNLTCAYCSRHDHGTAELSTAEVKAVMSSFARGGCRFWSFNGGEPLLRPDLPELAAHGKRLGLFVSLATNGTLLPARVGGLSSLDLVSVSLDGPAEAQNRARCASFDRAIAGIEALVSARIPRVFTTVVAGHNVQALGGVLDLAERYGARVYFQPVRVQKEDAARRSEALFPEAGAMQGAMRDLVAAKRRGRPVASSERFLELIAAAWPDRLPPMRCWAGRAYCFVTPEGFLTACCDTLALAGSPGTHALHDGPSGLQRLPDLACETCFSSVPLETNILVEEGWRRPWDGLRTAWALRRRRAKGRLS